MSLNTQNYQNIKPLLRNYVKIERVRITSAFLVVIEFLLGLLYILDFITFSEKALRIYLVIFFLSIVILSTAQFLKSKTVQRVERAMKNNDSSNLNHKGIKEVNKIKKVKKILFYGSILGFLGLSAVFISWFNNTEIGKSPLTWSIVSAVGFLQMIIFNIDDIPFLKKKYK